MMGMFMQATSFNGNINSWNVSSVTDMNYMFLGATSFNGNICDWNVTKVNIGKEEITNLIKECKQKRRRERKMAEKVWEQRTGAAGEIAGNIKDFLFR